MLYVNRIKLILWICSITVLGLMAAVSAQQNATREQLSTAKVAIIVTGKGGFTVVSDDGERKTGRIGMPVLMGDTIQTDRGSSIKLVFLDKTELALAGNAELVIKDYFYSAGEEPRSVVTVKNGAFQFMAGKIGKIAPQNFKIETETATIGIRGSGGSVITSDGSEGRSMGLELRTVAGHVLEVTTRSGEMYVVEDPDLGLRIDAAGEVTRFPVSADPFTQKAAQEALAISLIQQPQPTDTPSAPIENHTRLTLYIHRSQWVRLRKHIFKKIGESKLMSDEKRQKFEDLVASVHKDWESTHEKIRDLQVSAEKPSAAEVLKNAEVPTKSKATTPMKQADHQLRSSDSADKRERGSMSETLGKLSQKHLAKERNKEKANPKDG